jgi:hypothetical protein
MSKDVVVDMGVCEKGISATIVDEKHTTTDVYRNSANAIIYPVDPNEIPVATTTITEAPPDLPVAPFSYQVVDQKLKDAFNYKEANASMICDIMSMYIKGQKILYTEAKTICEQRLNYLMLPTIIITAVCTVISVVLKEYDYSSTLVSALNGVNFLFLNLINYLKLDAKAEAHRVSAYKFDKIQSKLEFNSGKMLFIKGRSGELPTLIDDTEKAVRDIKETNQFILPEKIRYRYPILNDINIFEEVKKIQSREILLINRLKDTMNDHVNALLAPKTVSSGTITIVDPLADSLHKERIDRLEKDIRSITDEIIRIKDDYLEIDKQFQGELKSHRDRIMRSCNLLAWLKS